MRVRVAMTAKHSEQSDDLAYMNNSFETEMMVASEGSNGDGSTDIRHFTDVEFRSAITNTFATT